MVRFAPAWSAGAEREGCATRCLIQMAKKARQQSRKVARARLPSDSPGHLCLHVEINGTVQREDMRLWSAERIARFFHGIAQVLKARKGKI